ncbi:MAG: tetratricopeptide repeat protein [Elusimicrobiota bacterium]
MSEKQQKYENHMEQGKLYFLNEKYKEAIAEYTKALDLDVGKKTEVYYNMGIAYEGMNNTEQAQKTYQEVLNIDPDHQLAKKHLDDMLE